MLIQVNVVIEDLSPCSLIPDTLLLCALVLLAVNQEQTQHLSDAAAAHGCSLMGSLYLTEKHLM